MRMDNSNDLNSSAGEGNDKSNGHATPKGGGASSASNTSTSPPAMPKHIPFPDYFNTSELTNELIMALFTTGAAILQFINIYRTNWWLPNSNVKNVVNLYQIEPHMRDLILLITTRRLGYCIILYSVKRYKQKVEEHRLLCTIFKYWFGGTQLAIMSYCVWKIYQPDSYVLLFFLTYPAIVYLLIFGFQMEPFMRTAVEVNGAYFNGMPLHCCTSNAAHIREEIETLRNDFNKRFKQLIFTSVINAYYSGLVPCMLAGTVQYNVIRAALFIFTVWLCAFSLCTVFLFPAKYSDILHRATLHLGYWQRLSEPKSETSTPLATGGAVAWCKNAVYANGSLVKYNGVLYRSLGPATVALPGNVSHARFFKLFHNPTIIYASLAKLQAVVILLEIFSLISTVEWHFLLSIAFVTFTNQFAFFKTVRDYLITKRLYNAESAISDKHYD